jgi:hypothetical protein
MMNLNAYGVKNAVIFNGHIHTKIRKPLIEFKTIKIAKNEPITHIYNDPYPYNHQHFFLDYCPELFHDN